MLILPLETLPFNTIEEFVETDVFPSIAPRSALEQTILVCTFSLSIYLYRC